MNKKLSEIKIDTSDLSNKQREFLMNEFNISKDDIENMTADKWAVIREKSFEIEAELITDNNYDDYSERCKLAISIVDYKR